jgi:putative NADPH-quinone reductase
MKALVVYCHPVEGSFCSAMRDAAVAGLMSAGHDVSVIDLAADDFDPVMSTTEWVIYNEAKGDVPPELQTYVDKLKSAQILVFVYPTYWSGMPAQLKGWLERVFMHGVAFRLNDKNKVRPSLQNISRLAVISTYGSPYWYVKCVNDNGRRVVTRALRIVTKFPTRTHRLGLYSMDRASENDRRKFIARIKKKMSKI